MQIGQIGRSLRHAFGDLRLLALQFLHARLHRRLIHAILDRRDDASNGAVDLVERTAVRLVLCAPIMIEAVHFLRIGTYCLGDRICRDELVVQAAENSLFDFLARDGPVVVAGAATMVIEAAKTVAHDEAIPATAAPAGEKAGKERDRPLRHVQPFRSRLPDADGRWLEQPGNLQPAPLDSLPEFIIDDPQMGNLGPDPQAFRVLA